MSPIMSLIEELNSLCKMYVSQKEEFDQKPRIRKIFTEFVREGYNIVTPQFDPTSEEFDRLSDIGKLSCERLTVTHKKKMEAINSEQYEFAADLRELERELYKMVAYDFATTISNRFFVLKSEESKEIIYNDYDGKLKDVFKLT